MRAFFAIAGSVFIVIAHIARIVAEPRMGLPEHSGAQLGSIEPRPNLSMGKLLLVNLAIGGSWGGQKGIDDSRFPQRSVVDYVRIYQPK